MIEGTKQYVPRLDGAPKSDLSGIGKIEPTADAVAALAQVLVLIPRLAPFHLALPRLNECHAQIKNKDAYIEVLIGENTALKAALAPFAEYAKRRVAMPLNSLGNSVHTIHGGTEWEAQITFEHCLAAMRLIDGSAD